MLPFLLHILIVKELDLTDKTEHFERFRTLKKQVNGIKMIGRAGKDLKISGMNPEDDENDAENSDFYREGYKRYAFMAAEVLKTNGIRNRDTVKAGKRLFFSHRKTDGDLIRPLTLLICLLFTVTVIVTGMIGSVYGYSQSVGIVESDVSMTGTDIFCWPLAADGRITSYFGIRSDPFSGEEKMHGGIDIAAALGTPVLAAADGTVTAVNMDDPRGGGYGYYVKLDHGGDIVTIYGHCSVICVTSGQMVSRGEMIARVGSTGNSTGDHLHFEIRINGLKQDPLAYFVNNSDISDEEA